MTADPTLSADFIETTDEEGVVHVFEKVDEYELDGKRYALLIYQAGDEESENGSNASTESDEDDEDGHDEEIVVMRISTDADGSQVFEAIEDEEEFNRVVAEIEKNADFGDDDDEALFSVSEEEDEAKA